MLDPMMVIRSVMQSPPEPAETLQAWATAALAEEQRTANLLALAEAIDNRFGGMLVVYKSRGVTAPPLVVEAARRMGLIVPSTPDDEDD